MTAADVARLEALRDTALGAMIAARGVLKQIDALLLSTDAPDPTANPWETFDTVTNPTGAANDGQES